MSTHLVKVGKEIPLNRIEHLVALINRAGSLFRGVSMVCSPKMVQLYEPFIAQWIDRFGVPASDRSDLTQDALTVLVKELPAFRHSGQTGAFRSWLRTVIVHRTRHYWRTLQTRSKGIMPSNVLDELEDPSSNMSCEWDRQHDAHVAKKLITTLEGEFSPATWNAFRRQVVEGAKAALVAEELGLSVNSVLLAKSRVLRRFREEAHGLIDNE
jgi:RNA polymerase sigma-70 factor (ECF subfamily)